jgi:hypothetical protein
MLKRLIGLTIITLLFVITANAQSQRPTPRPRVGSNPPKIQTSPKQQTTEYDKRDTEQLPFVVKTITPPKTQEEIDQSRKEHDEKTAIDNSLVRYTGILAIATAFLVLITIILSIVGWWQGKQLKRSVDSLIATERAYLFVTVQHAEGTPHVKWFSEFIVFNGGRTAAILINVNGSYEKVAPGDTIPQISPDGDHGITPNTIIIPGSPGIDDTKSFRAKKSQAFCADNRLVCIGRIQYKDIFGVLHDTGFCWEYMFDIEEFRPINDPKCNYHT